MFPSCLSRFAFYESRLQVASWEPSCPSITRSSQLQPPRWAVPQPQAGPRRDRASAPQVSPSPCRSAFPGAGSVVWVWASKSHSSNGCSDWSHDKSLHSRKWVSVAGEVGQREGRRYPPRAKTITLWTHPMNHAGANYFTQDSFNPQGNTGELWFREGRWPSQSHPASKGRAGSQSNLSEPRIPAKSSFLATAPHCCSRRALVLPPAVMSQHEYLLCLSMHHLSIYVSI